MKIGLNQIMEGFQLLNQERIRKLEEKENYKYTRILKEVNIKQVDMKETNM